MSTVENIQAQLDNGHFITGVFIDLKKAFDTVDHNILTQNLNAMVNTCLQKQEKLLQ